MDDTPGSSESSSDTGFISLVSPVQVRPPLLFSDFEIDHAAAEDHHSRPGHSASDIKCFLSGALEYYHRKVTGASPPKESAAMRHGTLIHLWCELGPDIFWQLVRVLCATLLTAAGARSKKSKEFEAEQDPKLIWITPSEEEQILRQTEGILLNPQAREILQAKTDAEFNCRWKWLDYQMRCRVDGATDDFWFDIKTTKETETHRCWWAFKQFRYDIQDSVYRAARRASGMWPESQMRFIITSNVWPHRCSVATLPVEVTDAADRVVLNALADIEARKDWDSWLPEEYGQTIEMPWPRGGSR